MQGKDCLCKLCNGCKLNLKEKNESTQQAGTICGTFVQHKSGLKMLVLFVFPRFATNRDKNVVNLAFRDKNVVFWAFHNKNVTI